MRRIVCWLFGHVLGPPRWLSAQASRRECGRCGRSFCCKERGEYVGALLPWDAECERFYGNFGLRRGAPASAGPHDESAARIRG